MFVGTNDMICPAAGCRYGIEFSLSDGNYCQGSCESGTHSFTVLLNEGDNDNEIETGAYIIDYEKDMVWGWYDSQNKKWLEDGWKKVVFGVAAVSTTKKNSCTFGCEVVETIKRYEKSEKVSKPGWLLSSTEIEHEGDHIKGTIPVSRPS